MMLISKSDRRLLNYLSSKPEEEQSNSLFHRQTQVRDEQRQEAQVPQEVLWNDGQHRACYYRTNLRSSSLIFILHTCEVQTLLKETKMEVCRKQQKARSE